MLELWKRRVMKKLFFLKLVEASHVPFYELAENSYRHFYETAKTLCQYNKDRIYRAE